MNSFSSPQAHAAKAPLKDAVAEHGKTAHAEAVEQQHPVRDEE